MGKKLGIKNMTFTHAEAVELIHCAVHPLDTESPTISQIGVVVGLLDMNDEVELIVKFQSSVSQFTKSEFVTKFQVEC